MTIRVSVITPTADQPTGIALAEKYMARQTVQPFEWIVADDGAEAATLTMGQTHIVRKRDQEGGRSLAGNTLAGLEAATGDVIVIWEHDDHYAPDHIEVCLAHLAKARAAGSKWQRYYNVEHRCWIVMKNIGSALCNTAFTADLIPAMQAACDKVLCTGSIGLDRMFWDSLEPADKCVHEIDTVVGIKGLPGRIGLGMGHRPGKNGRIWRDDPGGFKLREWVGEDAVNYGR